MRTLRTGTCIFRISSVTVITPAGILVGGTVGKGVTQFLVSYPHCARQSQLRALGRELQSHSVKEFTCGPPFKEALPPQPAVSALFPVIANASFSKK